MEGGDRVSRLTLRSLVKGTEIPEGVSGEEKKEEGRNGNQTLLKKGKVQRNSERRSGDLDDS